MKIHKVLLIVLGVLALSLAHRAAAQPVRPDTMYAESHALLVGVSDYTNGWPDLSGVTQDIEAVRQALTDLEFTVTVVMDPADKSEMDRAFSQFISAYGAQLDNRLLIYFAGHGKTITLADGREMGYIVPANAPLPANNQQGFIDTAMDMEQVQVYAKRIQAKHALFLFDSCFSGSIFSLGRGDPDRVIMDKANRPVRQFITSGSADEEVPDQSIFRRQFLAALRGQADIIPDGGDAAYVTGEELCAFLSHTVVDYSNGTQHPQCGKLRDPNLDKGDFVFVLPKAVRPTPTPGALPTQGEFVLDDLELRNQWRQYQQKVEQAYSQVEAYEQQALHTQDKREAWQRFLDYAQQDNPYSERDDDLRRQAQERLHYWQNVTPTPQPTPTPANTWTDSVTGMEFVRMPAGCFQMGSPDSEEDRYSDEGPVHEVCLDEFWMGKYEVTQAQWRTIMGSNPSRFEGENRPVERVSWNDAQEFITQLNRQSGHTFRLPTEAEWEYAARAGTTTPFYFGETISTDQANYDGDYVYGHGKKGIYRGETTDVGSFPANAFGLYDMHGNVWEWCQDVYVSDAYKDHARHNPIVTSGGSLRVLRGGSWFYEPGDVRSADRGDSAPSNRDDALGLRLVRKK